MTEEQYYQLTVERMDQLRASMQNVETFLGAFMVVSGIVISFIVAWYVYRLLVKPIVRTHIKFKI